MNYFERLKQLNDIHKILGVIIVEGYDEKVGFGDNAIKTIARLGNELEAIALLMYKEKYNETKSASEYGSIANNRED